MHYWPFMKMKTRGNNFALHLEIISLGYHISLHQMPTRISTWHIKAIFSLETKDISCYLIRQASSKRRHLRMWRKWRSIMSPNGSFQLVLLRPYVEWISFLRPASIRRQRNALSSAATNKGRPKKKLSNKNVILTFLDVLSSGKGLWLLGIVELIVWRYLLGTNFSPFLQSH